MCLRADVLHLPGGQKDPGDAGIKELTGAGDCGYIAFFNEDEKIIQLGNPDEVDGENVYAKSQTLFNSTFKKSSAWGTAAKSLWKVNSGITSSSSVAQNGSIGMGVASYAVPANPASTSGTLIKATSKAGAPVINYVVKAKTTNRTANSVKVTITITGSLGADASYFLSGYSLKASVYIGGAWRDVTLKKTTDRWRGKTGHSVNLSVTVTGLTASTNKLTGIKFMVTRPDNLGTAGILNATACANLPISTYVADIPETYYLTSANFGSGANWHGPSITRVLPADAAGDVGATNFALSYSQKMCIGSTKNATNQLGAFHDTRKQGNAFSKRRMGRWYIKRAQGST